jgi:hypothetical protein
MKRIFLFVFGYILATNIASAYTLSSPPINLTGGTVPPGVKDLTISLQTLTPSTTYDVTCDIENPKFDQPNPVVIKLGFPGFDKNSNVINNPNTIKSSSINGVTSPSNQYLLNHQISKYSVRFYMHGTIVDHPRLMFTNYDNSDSVYVKNCIATYATN